MSWSQNPSTYMFPSSHLPEGIPASASFLPSFLNLFSPLQPIYALLATHPLPSTPSSSSVKPASMSESFSTRVQAFLQGAPAGLASYGGKALWCKGTTASAIALTTVLPQARHVSAAVL